MPTFRTTNGGLGSIVFSRLMSASLRLTDGDWDLEREREVTVGKQ